MPQNTSTQKTVDLNDLNGQMEILAYTGFHDKYKSMDDKSCEWIKHNFKGAGLIVDRGGKKLEIDVSNVQSGDSLFQLHKFPSELRKLTIVTEKLIRELKKRGFSQFKVQEKKKVPTTAQEKRKEAVQQTSELVQKVKESVEVRDNATEAIESIMDNSRKGKVSKKEITHYVDNIVSNSSSDAISAITNLKESDQTYAHCVDVGAIFQVCYNKIIRQTGQKSVFEDDQQVLLSSFLHDFGKAKVPKDIIDSTARFEKDSREMMLIRKHPEYGVELLSKMDMPDSIIQMAHHHHVKLDTSMFSSYPEGIKFEDVSMETRLIAIIDIYQALVGKRSYKKSWAPPAAMKFIDQLAGVEYDLDIWNAFLKVMGRYPKGSAVELNDGSKGFVVNVPEENLDRPQVVIVRDGEDNDLEHHTLIDLEMEQDASIAKELDGYETFGSNVIEVFTSLQVI